MALLPIHTEMMGQWIDLIEEVIVVDSDSTDGSVDFLRHNLADSKLRFLNHPPGLYESWNYGIAEVQTRYTYISCVGDGISREGLVHLAEVADELRSDVVISPPAFIHESGKRKKRRRGWPVHTIISHTRLEEPVSFEGVLLFLIVVGLIPHAILGSSSSNLYRTFALQGHPFPTSFGHHGDGAWAVGNSLRIRLGVTPREVSYFRLHRRTYALPHRAPELEEQMVELAIAQLDIELLKRPELKTEATKLDMEKLLTRFREAKRWRTEWRKHRARSRVWMFNPRALLAKFRQSSTQRECDRLLKRLITSG
jgi:glycosyltransferase involved in cell wall biosynthesis